jgi:photosystem II stability/assembly factor-like uncharacterized protein
MVAFVVVAGGAPEVRPVVSYDEPDGAREYARLKRQAMAGSPSPIEAYRAAERQIARMPRYSSRLGMELPALDKVSGMALAAEVNRRMVGGWEALGPGNIGGRTRTLVIQPDDPATMYTGGVSGGVWKTTDGGASWQPIADEMVNIAVNSLVIDPEDPETLYAGTGEGYFREDVRGTWLPLRGAGIFVTSDGGAGWRRLEATTGEDFRWVNDLLISPHDHSRLYAATRTGVWRSADGGESWRQILASEVHGGCLDLAQRTDTEGDWLLASCGTLTQATVYRTGAADRDEVVWETALSEPGMGRTSLAVAPSNQQVVYALSASNLGGPGGRFEQGLLAVFRSDEAGAPGTWTVRVRNTDPSKLATLLLTNPASASREDCGWPGSNRWITMGWYCNVIAVDPVDPDVVWAAGVDLFRSDDGGRNWGLASYWWWREAASFAHADQHAIVFHPDYDGGANQTMFAANDGGVARTDTARAATARGSLAACDPGRSSVRFVGLNHNLGITQFYHGAPYSRGWKFIGGTQDNGTLMGDTLTGHDGWRPAYGGDGGYVAVDPLNHRVIYAETQWFGFIKSTDGGATFADAVDGVTDGGILFITPFVMDPNSSRRLWTGGSRLWRTDDGAGRWTAASADLSGPAQVSAVAVAPGNSRRVLAGTSTGDIYRTDAALTAHGGSRWDGARPRQGYVSWLAFDPASEDVVYATYAGFGGDHVWRSTDGGRSWTSLDGEGDRSVPDIPVHCIVVDPESSRRLYLGTDLGVMTSPDGGRTWMVENTGFANAVTESLAVTADQNGRPLLFAFTHGRGAWRVELAPGPAAPRRPGVRVGR